jgi:hypothetical protein
MNKWFSILIVPFLFGSFVSSYAQTDSISKPTRIKIDGVAAVIGEDMSHLRKFQFSEYLDRLL